MSSQYKLIDDYMTAENAKQYKNAKNKYTFCLDLLGLTPDAFKVERLILQLQNYFEGENK